MQPSCLGSGTYSKAPLSWFHNSESRLLKIGSLAVDMATLEYIRHELRETQANLYRLISTIETVNDLPMVEFGAAEQAEQTAEPDLLELPREKRSRRRWTSEETTRFKRMLDEGQSYSDVAGVFNVSVAQCRETAKQERKMARIHPALK